MNTEAEPVKKNKKTLALVIAGASAGVLAIVLIVTLSIVMTTSKPQQAQRQNASQITVRFSPPSKDDKKRQSRGKRTTFLGMKPLCCHLVEDVTLDKQPKGKVAMVFINSHCNGNLVSCAQDSEKHSLVSSDYFDFSMEGSTDEANSRAQSAYIKPGVYKYLKMDFCVPSDSQERLVSSVIAQFTNPIECKDGNNLTLEIGYGLDNLLSQTPQKDKSISYSLVMPSQVKAIAHV